MKKFLFTVSLSAKLTVLGFSGTANEPLDPYILRIDGPSDLGIGYTGTYTAPADKGRPPYTYSWSGVRGTVPNSTGSSSTFRAGTLGDGNIKATITDQDGKKDDETKAIKVHEHIEKTIGTSVVGSYSGDVEVLAVVIFTANFLTHQVAVTTTREWSLGGEVTSGDLLPVEIGISAERKWGSGLTNTMTLTGQPGQRVSAICYPQFQQVDIVYRVWEVGLKSSGTAIERTGESMVYTTR